MIDLKKLQKDIYQNKVEKGFNVSDVNLEFAYAHKELSEAFEAYSKKLADELADVLFIIICLANQTGVDLTQAFQKNMEKKTKRDKNRHHNNQKLKNNLQSPFG